MLILPAIATGIASFIASFGARLALKFNLVVAYSVMTTIITTLVLSVASMLFTSVNTIYSYGSIFLQELTFSNVGGEYGASITGFLSCSGIYAGISIYFNYVLTTLSTLLLVVTIAIFFKLMLIVRHSVADIGKML